MVEIEEVELEGQGSGEEMEMVEEGDDRSLRDDGSEGERRGGRDG